MKPRIFFVLAVILVFLASNAAALPNIKVNWVQYSAASERIAAQISNTGDQTAEVFTVSFYVDNEIVGNAAAVPALGPGSTTQAFVQFEYDGKSHQLRAVADEGNSISESNEQDNAASGKIDAFEMPETSQHGTSFYDLLLIVLGISLAALAIAFFVIRAVKKNE